MDLLAFNNTAKLDEVWKTDVQYSPNKVHKAFYSILCTLFGKQMCNILQIRCTKCYKTLCDSTGSHF